MTVTATDPVDNTHTSQTFNVTVVRWHRPASAETIGNQNIDITFQPLAFPVSQTVTVSQPATIQLKAATQNPNNSAVVLNFVQGQQPQHGTLTNFNTTTGTVTYTPTAGYVAAPIHLRTQ